MKKIFLLTSVVFMALAGCKKGLEPQLYGALQTTNYPKTEADFTNYVLEAYKPFQSKWGYTDADGSYQSDWFSPEYGDIQMFDYGTDIINTYTLWGGFYTQFSEANYAFLASYGVAQDQFTKVRTVTRITQIIADIANSSISATAKAELTAEAKMARGWNMYFLLQCYGPVPVILDPTLIGTSAESNMTRPERAAFVADIVSDLTFAAANLPVTPAEYGRFNQGLALTVLMRTYMNEKDFTDAEKVGRQIIALPYTLVTNYASLFQEATEQNSETIWAVSCMDNQDGSENHGSFNPWDFYTYPADYPGDKVTASYAPGIVAPYSVTWAFYNSFDPADKRRIPLIASYTNKSGGITNQASGLPGAVIAKYPDQGGNVGSYQGNDIPKARLGEVLLYLAEAINQNTGPTAEAIGFVNQVRAAHGGLGPVPTAQTTDKNTFDLWLLKEESWETYFEGERRMDLVRHGQYTQALATVNKTTGPYLFPVPTFELVAGNKTLTQTPGY